VNLLIFSGSARSAAGLRTQRGEGLGLRNSLSCLLGEHGGNGGTACSLRNIFFPHKQKKNGQEEDKVKEYERDSIEQIRLEGFHEKFHDGVQDVLDFALKVVALQPL